MNLQEHLPLPKLWLHSFSVTNKALPKLLTVLVLYVVLSLVFVWLFKLVAMSLSFLLIPFLSGSKFTVVVNMLLLALVVMFIFQFFNFIFTTAGIKIIAQTAEDNRNYLLETFFDSLKPAFWMVCSYLLVALISIPGAVLTQWIPLVGVLFNIVLFFLVYIRLIYNKLFIALAGQGPIDGLVNSWKMTGGMRYIDTLLMVIMLVGTSLLYIVASFALFKILYTQIPLHAAQFFDLSKSVTGWVTLLVILAILAFFCLCQLATFVVLTFLNRYYENGGVAPKNVFAPNPAVSVALPNFNPAPLPEEHVVEGLPPDTDHIARQKETAAHAVHPAPEEPPTITGMVPLGAQQVSPEINEVTQRDELGITQSSINTTEEDTNEITQHLNQVYTPSKQDVVQHGDEDRMPTILFDDDMAKQLENNALQQYRTAHKQDDDKNPPQDDGPIKMSK